jgi:acyl carrier protein
MKRTDIQNKLTTILVELIGCKADDVTDEATLEDLGADSLDHVEIIIAIEDEFGIDINDDEAEKIETVAQAIDHITRERA